VVNAASEISRFTDRIDILINNAAIHNDTSFEILEKADLDDCLQVYDVNSMGPLRVVKAFLTLLRKSKSGKIINISSESGSIGACGREKEFDYCMSKAALNMGTKLLSNYLKKDNIIVLAVHPGWMRTDMGGSNAELDPYETACRLTELFEGVNNTDNPVFVDNKGNVYPW
jgi:NAD(P)-dependent dehydrogenase (short-subunit alcohol dehydrogenase family)